MGGLSWSTLNQHCFSQKITHFASLLKTLVVCVLVGVLEALANFFNTATLGPRGPIISMATKSRCLYQEKHRNHQKLEKHGRNGSDEKKGRKNLERGRGMVE